MDVLSTQEFCLADLVRTHAAESPGGVALVYEGRGITWGELDERSNRVAQGLRALGVGRHDRVGFFDRNSPLYFEVLFGASKVAAISTSVNWRLSAREVATVLESADCKVIFVAAPYRETLDEALHIVGLAPTVVDIGDPGDTDPGATAPFEEWLARFDAIDPNEPVHADDVAVLVFTSGTTGEPKGVMLTNGGFRAALPEYATLWGYGPGDLNLMAMPLFHASVSWVLVAMWRAVPSILVREFEVAQLADHIRSGVTHTFLVPAVIGPLADLLRSHADELRLRVFVYGGSPIMTETLRSALPVLGASLTQAYGLTEALTSLTQLDPVDHVLEGPASERLKSVGKPLGHLQLKIVDPHTGNTLAAWETGEVWFHAAQQMVGYWRRPEETATTITPDGWVRSGDVGFLDEDGYLYLTDRIKDHIISGGENIYPIEVENVLAEHPAVVDVAVIGVPDERWGEAVKAVVVLHGDASAGERELIEFTRERIADYKCPKSVAFVDALPRNPSGKVLKRELRDTFA